MKSVGIGNRVIFIGSRHYPDRKKPCLVVERGNEALVLGAFRNEQMIEEFEKALYELFPQYTAQEGSCL